MFRLYVTVKYLLFYISWQNLSPLLLLCDDYSILGPGLSKNKAFPGGGVAFFSSKVLND